MFVTTPSANELCDKVQSWADELNWPMLVRVAKRFGDLHDITASEEIVIISDQING